MGRDLVDVAPFREAFERSGMTASDVARQLGFMRTCPDQSRVKRMLGIYPHHGGKDYRGRHMQRISRDRALDVCEILGLDPVDLGL